jgi:hypothetical protein
MRTPSVLIVVLSSLAIGSCGAGDSNGSATGNVIYAAARNIAPVVVATSSASSALQRSNAYLVAKQAAEAMPWWSGNLGGLIFQTLRDYQYPRDEGTVDATNLYKVLFEAGNAYEGKAGLLDAMTVKAVAAPFDFGAFTIADTYDKGKNGLTGQDVFMAAREVGNEKHMLLAMRQGDGSNIMQGVYNGDTKDLELNSLTLILYMSGSMAGDTYGIRSYIKGNEATHTFEFRFLQFSYNHSMDMYYYYSVIGQGVSQGEGSHFLFYGTSSTTGGSGNSSGYYCFAATDTENEYQAKFETYPPSGGGEIIDSGSPCYEYKTGAEGIDAQLTAHPLWGPSDITFDPATFVGGGTTHLELSL